MTKRLVLLIGLIACSAAVYLAGNGRVSLWDRDEPRFAETSRQMLESGDWVVPHYLDKPRTAKPAMIYWCQATAMRIFPWDRTFAARFPSAIAMVLLLIVLSAVLWKPLGPDLAFWTVFIFATSGLTIAAAKMCITDALLTLWITIAQLCLYAMWRGNRSWPMVLILSAMIGLAALTKGPVILGMQGMTLLGLLLFHWFSPRPAVESAELNEAADNPINVLDYARPAKFTGNERSANQDAPRFPWSMIAKAVVGCMIVAAIFLPWVIMVNQRSKNFIQTAVGHEVWDRMMTPLEQHVGPPGYYFLTVWVTFFPWSLLLPLAIGLGFKQRADPKVRFALSAVLGPWIMLECVRTKLPHYFLPAFPPLAFLAANALVQSLRGQIADLTSTGFVIASGIWAFLVALAASATWILIRAPLAMPIDAMIALSVLGVIFGGAVFFAFKSRRPAMGAVCMGLGTFAVVAVMYLWYLPNAQFLRLSPRVADILIEHHATGKNQVTMMEYMEPSLAFAQGGTIREATGDVGFLKKYEPQFTPWLVVTQAAWDKAPKDLQDDFDVIGKAFGLAYADHGKWMTVMVIHRKGSN